ncbi:serine/threonine-protein kinase [Streptomyces sp. NPDC089919]|uniref:serine/threonine-protein kinase n=1 Tax=Streptomyces sp. NPDC089919 TaxID=3155188 RepID=UPI00343B4FAF
MDTSGAGRPLVDGRFELLARLGSGGMGTVWRARDVSLDREVALKEVQPPDPAVTEANPALALTLRERAVREARALARLAHPHVVTIHQIVEPPDGSHPWIVMELVPGGSLHDRLQHGPLPVSEVLRIGLDVLSALRAAHAAGVQHRDVKPANVLMRPNGSAVLTDFGIAALRGTTGLTATGDLIGSPEYIAPERIRGEEGHPASDLWSLGMLMYVAAEGVHPLRRTTGMATMVAVLEEPIPTPTRSGALGPVLSQLLVRDPDARPDAERLELLLRAAANGSPATASGSAPAAPTAAPGPFVPAGPYGSPTPQHTTPGFGPANPYAPHPQQGGHPSGGYPLPGYPGATAPVLPTPARSTRRRGPLTALAVVAVLAAGTAGVVKLLPDGDSDGNNSARGGSSSSNNPAPSASDPSASSGDDSPATGGSATGTAVKGSQLTPAGVRAAIAAFKQVAGTDKVKDVNFYEDFAWASITPKGKTGIYDKYEYRNGVARRLGPGSTLDPDDKPIDLATVNWDALPGLFKRADKELNVEKPTMRYVIVDRGLIDKVASMRLYLSDEYGGGYLESDLKGTVTRSMPRS